MKGGKVFLALLAISMLAGAWLLVGFKAVAAMGLVLLADNLGDAASRL